MAGRKSKYNKKIADHICRLLSSDTYTVAEVCRSAGIGQSTYFDWLREFSEFSDKVARAREERRETLAAEAQRSLVKKLQGYTVQEVHITSVGSGKKDVNGKEIPKIKEQKTVEKHIQADSSLIMFVLTNTDPENWKNRQNSELTGKDGKDLFGKLTDDELDKKIADLERRIRG